MCDSVEHAQQLATEWLWTCTNERPAVLLYPDFLQERFFQCLPLALFDMSEGAELTVYIKALHFLTVG